MSDCLLFTVLPTVCVHVGLVTYTRYDSFVKGAVRLLTLLRVSQLLRLWNNFRWVYVHLHAITACMCIHGCTSLSLSLSLSLSFSFSLFLSNPSLSLPLQGMNVDGCYLLIRYPENSFLAPSGSSSNSGADGPSKKAGSASVKECYHWRTNGCLFGAKCRYRHVPSHEGIDLKD